MIDFIGLFIMLAGFVIGLGAVTVIDFHGLLARNSSYWTEATIRAHRVTKPLIWIGTGLAILGGLIFYRSADFSGIPLIHFISALVLILNGSFLTFYISPYLLKKEAEGKSTEILPQDFQKKITISFFVSFFGWWFSLALLVWYVLKL